MKKRKNKKSYFFYDFVKITAAIPGLLWFRPKRIYASEAAKQRIRGGALLIANHSSNIDPIILMFGIYYRRHHFIATKELFDTRFKRFWFENFHCIEIDRENFGMGSFRSIIDMLKADKLISMFPEGHVTNNEEVQKFKSGMVLMAVSSGKPIVPVYIKVRKRFWQRQYVIIGEPINPTAMLQKMSTLSDMDRVAELLREKEKELKEIADSIGLKKRKKPIVKNDANKKSSIHKESQQDEIRDKTPV